MYSSNERLAVQEFMHSFRKRLSSIKPNFRLFKYPYAESNNKESNDDEKETGISTNMSALFVSSAITGSAILYLPLALKESGWLGVFMIIICGINSLYAGMILGWCWNIMQESWPEYKKPNEIPYPEMGRRAVGDWMKFMAIIDVFCSSFFILLLLIGFFFDKERIGPVKYPPPTFSSFTMSFGSLMFSYAGGGVYPTIQNAMENKKMFPQSVFTGFLSYGHSLGSDITQTLEKNENLKGLAHFLQVLSLTQLTTTLIIYLNPTFQILEYLLECPKRKSTLRKLLQLNDSSRRPGE
ncbi:uncharacterized protein LOC129966394 [Argiope bruennichi]|uniref:uncharacterized protein LOC129966394 n=1 Tax=Argiope bruennichi TaxID=94029 RepID=UPI002494C30C|nr:uncharacterized protein LOC129966394 [Argiope bruennichi]